MLFLIIYRNIKMVGYFNIEPADEKSDAFCESHKFYNLINVKTDSYLKGTVLNTPV